MNVYSTHTTCMCLFTCMCIYIYMYIYATYTTKKLTFARILVKTAMFL